MKYFFTLLAILNAALLEAGIDTKKNSKTGSGITVNAIVEVSGPHYTSPTPESISTRNWFIENTYGMVKLSYPIPTTGIRPTGTAKVVLKIDYQVEENGSYVAKSVNKELTVTLASATATDVAYFKVNGAQYIKATVQTGTSIPSDFTNLTLDAIVETNSFTKLEKLDEASVRSGLSPTHSLTSDGNLKISWTALTAAEAYQLEWTYVSNQDPEDRTKTLAASEIEVDRFLFRNNGSRVEVNGNSFEIPMIYEKGIILYRLRGIGKNVSNGKAVPFTTEWTVADGTESMADKFPHYYTFNGHEEDLNWQSQINFGEEAKNKVKINYFDGSLRKRQAVTRINTDLRSLVGETFYDYTGREAIEMLPVPVTQNKLSFYPHFNLIEINGQNRMDKAAYDKSGEGKGTGCELTAPKFSPTTGSSQYYSPQNNFRTAGNTGENLLNRELIPDAEKYPYTQMIYTPDNTNRLASVSGLGSTHQIGQGKDTRFSYGTPLQPEISRLFGMQAGLSGHYKKNARIDPNGQTTVSYLDMEGKTIATALAGAKPDNLTELAGASTTKSVNAQLIEPSTNILSENKLSLVLSKKFTVTARTNYIIKYSGTVGTFNLTCTNPSSKQQVNYNFKGATNYKVSLLDKCKNPVFVQKGCTGCTSNSTTSLNMPTQSMALDPGEYQISKTLSINEDALDQYFQDYLNSSNTCVLARDSFYTAERKKVNLIGCGLTCQKCQEEVEKVINSSPGLTERERQILRSSCNSLCQDEAFNCRSALEAMRGDMSPGGQYGQLRKDKLNYPETPKAELDENNQPIRPNTDVTFISTDSTNMDAGNPDDNKITVKDFPLSIYNMDNSLTVPKYLWHISDRAYWKSPIAIHKPGFSDNGTNSILNSSENLMDATITYSLTDYKDIKGNMFYATVYLTKDANGVDTYLPKIDSEGLGRLVTVDASKGIYKVPVRNLDSIADFERYWQAHWANYLVPYHPEYGYLKQCTSEKNSHDFDYQLINATTYDLARQAGFIDANNNPAVLSKDQFVQNDPSYKFWMTIKNSYLKEITVDNVTRMRSMAEVATIMINCPRLQTACGNGDCTDGKLNTDEEWTAYKALYFAEKLKLIKKRSHKLAVDSFYYNGCIGHKNFLDYEEANYFKEPVIKQTPIIVLGRSCTKSWLSNFLWNGYNCQNGTFTIYKNEKIYPHENPAQVCYKDKDDLYEKKAQRFYPQTPSGVGGGEIVENCSTFVQGPNNEEVIVTFPCAQDAQAAMEEAVEDAQRYKYSTCGLCPLASEINDFLQLLKKNKKLVSIDPLIVSCDLHPVRIGELLRKELSTLSPVTSPAFYWRTTINGNRLTGEFTDGTSVLAKLELAIPNGYDSRVNFSNLGNLCCLNIVAAGQSVSFPYEEGKIFSLLGVNPFTREKFRVEGRFDIKLSPCTIPPKCMVTYDASRATLFLNALANYTPEIPSKNHVLNTNGVEVDLIRLPNQTVTNQLLVNYYSEPVRAVLKKDGRTTQDGYISNIALLHPTWTSTVQQDGTLEGELKHTNGSVVIEMSGLESHEYALVDDIYNLRPNKLEIVNDPGCQSQDCAKQTFLADVKIIENNLIERKTVSITVPSMIPVTCNVAKKALIK